MKRPSSVSADRFSSFELKRRLPQIANANRSGEGILHPPAHTNVGLTVNAAGLWEGIMMGSRASLALHCCVIALIAGNAQAQTSASTSSVSTNRPAIEPPPSDLQGITIGTPTVQGQPRAESAAQSPDGTPRATVETAGTNRPDTGDIVVTARRRSESIQKVPISIIAVTGATLRSQGVQDLKQFSSFAPGVSINNGRADGGGTTAQIFIRGVGQNDFLIPNEPGVGLYVDDVYVASSSGALNSLGDVESIEVLRGPQGTLYGKNTIGGAIRITTVKPDLDTLSGNASVAAGSYNRIDISAGINVPLADTVALRLSAISRNTDDLQKRYLNKEGSLHESDIYVRQRRTKTERQVFAFAAAPSSAL